MPKYVLMIKQLKEFFCKLTSDSDSVSKLLGPSNRIESNTVWNHPQDVLGLLATF